MKRVASRMTIRDLLETLGRATAPKVSERVDPPVKKIDWDQRKKEKYYWFKKQVNMLGGLALLSLIGIIIPLWIVSPAIGKSLFISLPPMAFLTLSWMVPAWIFFYDKKLLYPTTVGAAPIRIVIAAIFSYWVFVYIPSVVFHVFFFGMMWHWVLFFIPEAIMLHHFSKIK